MINKKHILVIMQKLYSVLNYAADTSGDLLLSEYACLVTISEFENGLSIQRIKQALSGCNNPAALITSLEDKELVERMRSKLDRRAFSLFTTAKGRSRIDLMDEALSFALIDASDRLTEATFNQLQNLFYDSASPGKGQGDYEGQGGRGVLEGQRKITTLLPGSTLSFLCNYHSAAVKESSLFGISSTQAVILILIGETEAATSAERIAQLLLLPTNTLLLHLEKLEARGLVKEVNGKNEFILLDEGHRRVDSFIARFESTGRSFGAAMEQLDKDRMATVEDLLELLLYLFLPQGNISSSRSQRTSIEQFFQPDNCLVASLLAASTAAFLPRENRFSRKSFSGSHQKEPRTFGGSGDTSSFS